jgi:hypothetical protein
MVKGCVVAATARVAGAQAGAELGAMQSLVASYRRSMPALPSTGLCFTDERIERQGPPRLVAAGATRVSGAVALFENAGEGFVAGAVSSIFDLREL